MRRFIIGIVFFILVAAPSMAHADDDGKKVLGSLSVSGSASSDYALLKPMTKTGKAEDGVNSSRPNIVLITVDDMSRSDLQWMPITRRLIGGQNGTTFNNFISPHPLCCPARAEILTGQYSQNNGVRHNAGPNGGYKALRKGPKLPDWLTSAGYQTAFLGKYLNSYHVEDIKESGWGIWNPYIKRVYNAYNMKSLLEGKIKRHTTDYIGAKTEDYIGALSEYAPFFIWSSFVAPHKMYQDGKWHTPIPPPRHADLYPNVESPSVSKPSFNGDASRMNEFHRQRMRSLRTVDVRVRRIVNKLRDENILDNTVIIFTSDNGFMLGEQGKVGKNYPYNEALDVPLLMRGPGIPAGTKRGQMVSMIDLAPTILKMAGAKHPGVSVDGRNLMPVIKDNAPGYDYMLIQGGENDGGWKFRGVLSNQYTWSRSRGGQISMYDNNADPYQLNDLGDASDDLRQRFNNLKNCSGKTCRSSSRS